MIYADNAATTRLSENAFAAMQPYLLEQYGNASQPYSFSRPIKKALKHARETVAECIGAFPEEIFFTSGGTESDNWVIKSSLFLPPAKNQIITSQIEHHAILNSCDTVQKLGIDVKYLPVDRQGVINPAVLKDNISENTGIVSIMYANNEVGTIEPIKELSKIAHDEGSLFHTDAVQAVGHVPIDVKKLGIDLLSASSHKFNGPKGIGFLYMKKGTSIHQYADGGSQENGNRAGTENIASIVGMVEALKENTLRMNDQKKKLLNLEDTLIKTLISENLDFIRNGAENHLPGNVNVSFRNADGEMLLHRLDLMGICVSTGSACDSVNTKISHVLQAIRVPEEYAKGTIRITFGVDNTPVDAVKIAKSIGKILS